MTGLRGRIVGEMRKGGRGGGTLRRARTGPGLLLPAVRKSGPSSVSRKSTITGRDGENTGAGMAVAEAAGEAVATAVGESIAHRTRSPLGLV